AGVPAALACVAGSDLDPPQAERARAATKPRADRRHNETVRFMGISYLYVDVFGNDRSRSAIAASRPETTRRGRRISCRVWGRPRAPAIPLAESRIAPVRSVVTSVGATSIQRSGIEIPLN